VPQWSLALWTAHHQLIPHHDSERLRRDRISPQPFPDPAQHDRQEEEPELVCKVLLQELEDQGSLAHPDFRRHKASQVEVDLLASRPRDSRLVLDRRQALGRRLDSRLVVVAFSLREVAFLRQDDERTMRNMTIPNS
jgi:hypothetical protein